MSKNKLKYTCKYCGVGTKNAGEVCSPCNEKLQLIRTIRKMLAPYYNEKKNGEQK